MQVKALPMEVPVFAFGEVSPDNPLLNKEKVVSECKLKHFRWRCLYSPLVRFLNERKMVSVFEKGTNPVTQRVGIFGGTFDPIHYGHLRMAEEARDQFRLNRVLFVPNQISPLKAGENITPGRVRAEMVQAAIAGNPDFALSRIELERLGMSYTVETLRQFKRDLPESDLFFLTGTDAVRDLAKWREPEELLTLAQVIAATRPGAAPDDVLRVLPPDYARRILFMEMPGLDISATDLRERVRESRSIRYLTPPAVIEIIGKQGFYLPDPMQRRIS